MQKHISMPYGLLNDTLYLEALQIAHFNGRNTWPNLCTTSGTYIADTKSTNDNKYP